MVHYISTQIYTCTRTVRYTVEHFSALHDGRYVNIARYKNIHYIVQASR